MERDECGFAAQEAAATAIQRQIPTAQHHCIKILLIEEVEKTSRFSRSTALVIRLTRLSVVDVRRLCQPLRTEWARHRARLDCDWYVSAFPNHSHAGEDRGPQIDGCESDYEHRVSARIHGNAHFVFMERVLPIGP
jgi:hypothetical protein